MFSDPFTAVMVLVVLNFAGVLALFLFILRSLEATQRAIHDARANVQLRMADMEQQVNDMAAALRELAAAPRTAGVKDPADLGEILEKGLPNLRRQHDGFDLPDLKLSDVADAKKPGGSAGDGSGPLDISL